MIREIRDYHSRMLIGTIEEEPNGDRTVRNLAGIILGQYVADRDLTIDFYGRPLYIGDVTAALLLQDQK